jgi:hypothetical protein
MLYFDVFEHIHLTFSYDVNTWGNLAFFHNLVTLVVCMELDFINEFLKENHRLGPKEW